MGSKVASTSNIVEQPISQVKTEGQGVEQPISQVKTEGQGEQQSSRRNVYSFISPKDVKITTTQVQGDNNLNQSIDKDPQKSNLFQSQESPDKKQNQQVQKNDEENQFQNDDQNKTKTQDVEGTQHLGQSPIINLEKTQPNQSALFSIKECYYPWLIKKLGQFGQYEPPETFEDQDSVKVNTTILPNQSKYEGFMKNGKMHGYGTNLFEKELFEGNFQDGVRKGWGRSITEDTIKSGYWDKDKIQKKMEVQREDMQYKGECKDSVPNGNGELKRNTITYKGDFVNGSMHGTGVYEDSQQKIKYEGQFAIDKFNGHGTYYFSSGKKYVGQFKNSQFNGQGEMFWPNNSYYKGQFVDGLFDGWGYYLEADQTIYDGYWKKGKKNGKGKLTSKNIEVFGIWEDDVLTEND